MRRRPLLVGAGIVVALAVAGVAVDWWAQNREMDRILDRIEASEATVNRLDPAIEAIFAEYIGRGALPPEERATLFARIERVAAESVRRVDAPARAVAGVRVLPWHRDLARARDGYVQHVAFWQARSRALARDAEAAYPERSPAIDSTYREALDALRRAVPRRPTQDFAARLRALEPQ